MALTLFNDPFMTEMDRTMNRMLNTFMPGMGGWGTTTGTRGTTAGPMDLWRGTTGTTITMPMDIIETPQAFELHADTPGMTPDDIKVELHEGVLTLSGNRKVTRDEKDPTGKVWRSERSSYSFARSFTLPDNVDSDNICASMDKGVLKVCVPKKEVEPKAEPKRITVKGEMGSSQMGTIGGATGTTTTTGGTTGTEGRM
ncbi:hypothetical protein GPECTOR_32g424 [Gonium pectorale]|uniref:SHSP domain-containing protein n=1 Tax=Gonium pectorale TaxID=33097 RepID=A0A150GD97_GONPE|nr:hypothetical protein GPECTOR_32g424 [Gonium pectorale]|eukprot:KXZ47812.1 hypothetical protein GPECTOR_32g424 [Gonium pectorale]